MAKLSQAALGGALTSRVSSRPPPSVAANPGPTWNSPLDLRGTVSNTSLETEPNPPRAKKKCRKCTSRVFSLKPHLCLSGPLLNVASCPQPRQRGASLEAGPVCVRLTHGRGAGPRSPHPPAKPWPPCVGFTMFKWKIKCSTQKHFSNDILRKNEITENQGGKFKWCDPQATYIHIYIFFQRIP